jgi:paired amphipathic helix protein Sin3a
MGYNPRHVVAGPSSPRRVGHHPIPVQSARSLMNDDAHFFDRVKLFMADRDIYNEFLKLVNLFAQDFIDTPRLVKESRNFLGSTDLYRQFLNILGWDEKKEMEHYRNEQATSSGWSKPVVAALPVRPGRVDMAEKYGSYRRVSTSVCSSLAAIIDSDDDCWGSGGYRTLFRS